jgi:hypothetical protein
MLLLARRIELPHDMPVQRSHDADARHLVGLLCSTTRGQRFERGLPFLELLFGLRKLLDIFGGNLESDELAAAGQPDRIIERAFPTAISHHGRRAAERLHGEFDVVRLEVTPALDFGGVTFLRKSLKVLVNFSRMYGPRSIAIEARPSVIST